MFSLSSETFAPKGGVSELGAMQEACEYPQSQRNAFRVTQGLKHVITQAFEDLDPLTTMSECDEQSYTKVSQNRVMVDA